MKHFFTTAVMCAVVVFCCSCGAGRADVKGDGSAPGQETGDRKSGEFVVQHTDVAMGTVIQMSLYGEDAEALQQSAEDVMELLQSLEQEQISWRLETSEIYRINASAGSAQGVVLSEEMSGVLEKSMEMYERSEGTFDITLGALAQLWNIDSWAAGQETGAFTPPSKEAVEEALDKCGFEKLRMEKGEQEGGGGCVLWLPLGMQIDLGAVGKGLAHGEIEKLLESRPEITGAVISLGGSVLTWGGKPEGGSWRIGITDPFDISGSVGILTLSGQWCVSTSGDYERYVELDGVRYHHILDPGTGYPADGGVRGVTILAKEGLLADALSTACFILGPEKGMELAEEYGAEALFILSDKEVVLSEGMKKYFTQS